MVELNKDKSKKKLLKEKIKIKNICLQKMEFNP
jgi:hypothetical protein